MRQVCYLKEEPLLAHPISGANCKVQSKGLEAGTAWYLVIAMICSHIESLRCSQAQREAQALLRNKEHERENRRAEERAANEAVQSLRNDLVNLQRQAGMGCIATLMLQVAGDT